MIHIKENAENISLVGTAVITLILLLFTPEIIMSMAGFKLMLLITFVQTALFALNFKEEDTFKGTMAAGFSGIVLFMSVVITTLSLATS